MKAKKLIAIAFFILPLIADLLLPGSGLVIELTLLMWELLQPEEEDVTRSL